MSPRPPCRPLSAKEATGKKLKIASINITTLYPKIDEIELLIYRHSLDILCLNETRLDKAICDNEVKIKNYALVRNDRSRRGGGVALYIHESISFSVCTELFVDDLELVWCKISPEFQTSFLLHCM